MLGGRIIECSRLGLFGAHKVPCDEFFMEVDDSNLQADSFDTDGSTRYGFCDSGYSGSRYLEIRNYGSMKKISVYTPSLKNYLLNRVKYGGPSPRYDRQTPVEDAKVRPWLRKSMECWVKTEN